MYFKKISETVKKCLQEQVTDFKSKNYLIAISAGCDSVLMAYVFKNLGLKFELAHVNYHLRGKDSNRDQDLCQKIARKFKVKIHLTDALIPVDRNVSLQMIARDLRYRFFDEILKEENCNYLVLAHHADDQVETVMLNLFRGTGLKGMRGMSLKNGKKLRPFLSLSKKEILKACAENDIEWRYDKSNEKSDYKRNYLRNKILPKIEDRWPALRETMMKNAILFGKYVNALKEEEKKYDFKKPFVLQPKQLYSELNRIVFSEALSKNGFDAENFIKLYDKNSTETKTLLSVNGSIEVKHKQVYFYPLNTNRTPGLEIKGNKVTIKDCELLQFKSLVEKIDRTKVKGKLLLRQVQPGDKMMPLGMKGMKKISDMLTDLKLSKSMKQKVLLLVDDEKVVWLVGFRIDDRVKTESGKQFRSRILTLSIG